MLTTMLRAAFTTACCPAVSPQLLGDGRFDTGEEEEVVEEESELERESVSERERERARGGGKQLRDEWQHAANGERYGGGR